MTLRLDLEIIWLSYESKLFFDLCNNIIKVTTIEMGPGPIDFLDLYYQTRKVVDRVYHSANFTIHYNS
ncbi:uncharacterized protein OCT59_005661 [Rhizophagus irregularis]|uniref:uncharacterized protein n=1 Tax=Rhizophagus irregularis TaxID=588596 RepID=UPI003327D5A7|nr:hypothetical protein OCT59_005661 [Rhizophagus irregularis]